MNSEKLIYTTSDVSVAAALLTMGFTLQTINPTNPTRIQFIFDPTEVSMNLGINTEEAARAYWNNELLVNPKEFINSRRELLTRVHESQRQLEN